MITTYYGVWDNETRVISGLLNGSDIDLFLDHCDKVSPMNTYHTEEEELDVSASCVISLVEAIAEHPGWKR